MSDRTPSSVRTGARDGDGVAEARQAHARRPPADAAIPRHRRRQAESRPRRPSAASPPPAAGQPPAGPAMPARGAASGRRCRRRSAPPVRRSRSRRRPPSPGPTAGEPDAGRAAGAARAARDGGRGPRRARLQLRHIDTWSALKISLVLSIALFFIWMVAVGVLYGVLSAPRRLRHPQRPLRPARQRLRQRGDRRRHHPGHRLRRRGDHRRDQHRAADRAVHRRRVHLQPVLRPGRRPRGHPLRAGLSERPRRTGRSRPRQVRFPGSRACSSDG